MFPPSHIKKCIMCKEEIWEFVKQARTPMTAEHLKAMREVFRAGDAFHHPRTMKPSEYKTVTGVIPYIDLYVDNPLIAYRIKERVILPTEELLKAGLDAPTGTSKAMLLGRELNTSSTQLLSRVALKGLTRRPAPASLPRMSRDRTLS